MICVCARKSVDDLKRGAGTVERKLVSHEREGKLKGLLKASYLRRWVGTPEISGSEAAVYVDNEENYSSRKSAVDFARLVNIYGVLGLRLLYVLVLHVISIGIVNFIAVVYVKGSSILILFSE